MMLAYSGVGGFLCFLFGGFEEFVRFFLYRRALIAGEFGGGRCSVWAAVYFSLFSMALIILQPPSNTAVVIDGQFGVAIFPTTRAVRPSWIFSVAIMSPLTVPFILATATVTFASTWPFASTISVPPSDEIVPVRCPSTRSIIWKFVSPWSVVPCPTKPLRRPSLMSLAIDSLSATIRGWACWLSSPYW